MTYIHVRHVHTYVLFNHKCSACLLIVKKLRKLWIATTCGHYWLLLLIKCIIVHCTNLQKELDSIVSVGRCRDVHPDDKSPGPFPRSSWTPLAGGWGQRGYILCWQNSMWMCAINFSSAVDSVTTKTTIKYCVCVCVREHVRIHNHNVHIRTMQVGSL